MTQLGSLAVLIGVIAVLLAALGAVVAWWNEEGRRIRRGLRKVLRGETHALIIAPGTGRGAGFNFTSNMMAVAWDTGGWCLIYRMDELIGAELTIDGQVAARIYRGEARRPLDAVGGAERQVALRLVFDDPHHPDFILELWTPADARRLSSAQAVEEGNRWLARTESLFRRKTPGAAPRPSREPGPPSAPDLEPKARPVAQARPQAPAGDPRQDLPFDLDEQDEDEDEDDQALSR